MKSEEMKYRTMRWMLLALVPLLTACSDDPSPERQRVTVEASSCATGFEEVGNSSTSPTRAWTPPSSYVTYNDIYGTNGMFADQKDLVNNSIYAFFTQGENGKQVGTFYYRDTESKWYLNTLIEHSGTYQVYGYIPREDAEGADVAPLNGDYSNGAVLTINGLNTVTPSDVCIIIGAKDGRGAEDDTGETVTSGVSDGIRIAPGKFDVSFTGGESATNNIFLLFEHIYSSLRFRFTVDEIYNKLRTIRLRKLELIAYTDANGGGVKAKYDATITLQKNNTGTSPIVGNIDFTPVSSSAYVAPTPLYEWDGTKNTAENPNNEIVLKYGEYTNFMGCFVPGVNTYFKLRSTYDVYDKNATGEGNLIRKNCQAENTIDLREKFQISGTMPGHQFTYRITVQPTYLYMLSEPDVDNPTVVVN